MSFFFFSVLLSKLHIGVKGGVWTGEEKKGLDQLLEELKSSSRNTQGS